MRTTTFISCALLAAALGFPGCATDEDRSSTAAADTATTSDANTTSDSATGGDAAGPDTAGPDAAGPDAAGPDAPGADTPIADTPSDPDVPATPDVSTDADTTTPTDVPLIPGRCWFDDDCAASEYCNPVIELAEWYGECLAKTGGGAAVGEACDDNTPCEGELLCRSGFCSRLCRGDADCNTGADQVCAAEELRFDFDHELGTDAVQWLTFCDTIDGKGDTSCFSDSACPTGDTCRFWIAPNRNATDELDPDGPYTVNGVCRTPESERKPFGEECDAGSECQSGLCLGFVCARLCESSSECPDVQIDGETVTTLCQAGLWTGREFGPEEHRNFISICREGTKEQDCSDDFTCDFEEEACLPRVIAFGPDYAPTVEYYCDFAVLFGGTELGASCDPDAKDELGNTIQSCISGGCARTPDGGGVCTRTCKPGDDAGCAMIAEGMKCLENVIIPRAGAYTGNAASVTACYFEGFVGPADE